MINVQGLNLIPRLIRSFNYYRRGSLEIPCKPLFFFIELTNICNLKCVMCPQSLENSKDWRKGYMTMSLYNDILHQIKDFSPIAPLTLHIGGESLLHPQFTEMVALATSHGFNCSVSTNGTLLTQERIVSIIDSGLGFITIDFSANKKKYEEIRKGAKWEKTYNNLLNLLEYKKKTNHQIKITIKDISLDRVYNKENRVQSLRKLKLLFSNLPVNVFEPYQIHNWSGTFAEKHQAPVWYRNTKTYVSCSHPWFAFNILWDGKVVPCCRDIERKYVVGDVNQDSISNIWNSKKLMNLRRLLVSGAYNKVELCRNCDRIWGGGKRGGKLMSIVSKNLGRILRLNF